MFTEVTFRYSAEYDITCGSDLNSAQFWGILQNSVFCVPVKTIKGLSPNMLY